MKIQTIFRRLVKRQRLARVAQRVHQSAVLVGKWLKTGKIPKKYEPIILAAWKRSERARKAATAGQSKERREIRKLRAQLAERDAELKSIKRKRKALDYWGLLDEMREKFILTPERSLRKLSEKFGLPLRTVYTDYFSPGFSGAEAA